jgi:pyridinium-3,5-bisthiocarboxylic acid mononucleotide nickel chelatase
VLCRQEDADRLKGLIFRETTTLGVRQSTVQRSTLQRETLVMETPLGPIRMKVARSNGQIMNAAPEYEDCQKIASERGLPLKQVLAEASFHFQKYHGSGK